MDALLFPGQGSQQVGMGRALVDVSAAAARIFEEADDVLAAPISRLCFEGPETELTLTANTQPAILTCSVAALMALRERMDIRPKVAMGHSLGEFSALVAAGALTFADALRLVRIRGQAMQEAVPPGSGAMAAIVGLDGARLDELCTQVSANETVSAANENGGGQIVVAGHAAAVARLCDLAKSQGARAIPLRVSAPFHCALMAPAAARLAAALTDVTVHELAFPVVSNVDGAPNQDRSRVKNLLIAQVTQRVRWEASVQWAASQGIETAIEVGHGKVLAGLIKRIVPTWRVLPCGSPEDIDVLKGPGHVGA